MKENQLLSLLQRSRHTIAVTGAGISTLSGIPDFRSAKGIFHQQYRNLSVEELHDIEIFRAHPEYFYGYSKNFSYDFDRREPSIVHRVLARLEARKLLQGVYTQNIDGLHQRAGSSRVLEFHGSIFRHRCLGCGESFEFKAVQAEVKSDRVPHCDRCGGLIKPEVVFFGEALPEELLETAFAELPRTELVLVLGSTLAVYPVAAFPRLALERGGKLAIVNRDPTPFDGFAELRRDDLEATFRELEEVL